MSKLCFKKNLFQHLGKQLGLGLSVAQTDAQSAWSAPKQRCLCCRAVPGVRGGQRRGGATPPPLQGPAGPAEAGLVNPDFPGPAGEGGASCRPQEWGFGLWEPNMEVAGCEGKLQVEA